MRRPTLVAGGFAVLCAGALPVSAGQNSRTAGAALVARSVTTQYCVTCHNDRLRTAGLTLENRDAAQPGTNAAVWEKVVRKLRAGAMPPVGAPRPDEATLRTAAAQLEMLLDQAGASAPNPGRHPALHRLNRAEYQNAVRDLLALESVPKAMEIAALLPPDNVQNGFDNMAEAQFVSPALLDRYLAAARKISRLAIGDMDAAPIVDIYRLTDQLPQDEHREGLPLGTRGGTLIRSTFQADGTYVIKIDLPRTRARDSHQLEVSVDGERVRVFEIGGTTAPGGPPREVPANVQVRAPIKAGPHVISVAFVKHDSALSEAMTRPFLRTRGEMPAIERVTVMGPYESLGVSDTPSRRRVFVCRPTGAADELPCVRRILTTLVSRAHRRPATVADVAMLMPFYQDGRAEGGFERGIQQVIERLLISPEFLFRIERDPARIAPGAPYRISNLELASRLSFFLWSSIPDDELLDTAIRGRLSEPAVLEHQVRRMLADSRAEALGVNFAGQWLYLRDIIEASKPDERLFPDFDETLREAMRRETELFVGSVLQTGSVLELLSANYTFLNERLAKHYGVPNIYGTQFRRVLLGEESPRRGLLGHGSLLTVTSYSTRTSPVLRGKWVLETLLASPPPPPPANVPALKDTTPDGKVLSMRDRMVQHRANPACSGCHSRMDPLGFALENFDAVGRWRTRGESDTLIDASGVLPNGTKFDGVAGLRAVLLRQPDQFVQTVTEKLLAYALGRGVDYYDQPTVRAITRETTRAQYRFSALIIGIVKSAAFQMRTSQS